MIVVAAIVWELGLGTLVPYAGWYLLFEAPRDEYALLITLILFWVFGYWRLVAPLLMAVKVRVVFRGIESSRSGDDLARTLRRPETRDVAIDLIARDNGLPRFLTARVSAPLVSRLTPR